MRTLGNVRSIRFPRKTNRHVSVVEDVVVKMTVFRVFPLKLHLASNEKNRHRDEESGKWSAFQKAEKNFIVKSFDRNSNWSQTSMEAKRMLGYTAWNLQWRWGTITTRRRQPAASNNGRAVKIEKKCLPPFLPLYRVVYVSRTNKII